MGGKKIRLANQAVSQPRCCILERETSPQKSVNVVFIKKKKKHHGVFSHGGGKNTTLVERGEITSEINGFANVSLLALAKPAMIKFLFVSGCLHPSPPRSLPVTLEQKKKKKKKIWASGDVFSGSGSQLRPRTRRLLLLLSLLVDDDGIPPRSGRLREDGEIRSLYH